MNKSKANLGHHISKKHDSVRVSRTRTSLLATLVTKICSLGLPFPISVHSQKKLYTMDNFHINPRANSHCFSTCKREYWMNQKFFIFFHLHGICVLTGKRKKETTFHQRHSLKFLFFDDGWVFLYGADYFHVAFIVNLCEPRVNRIMLLSINRAAQLKCSLTHIPYICRAITSATYMHIEAFGKQCRYLKGFT